MYNGQERIAEPHDYGIQNGILRLFCYQVGGQSSSRLPGWRLVDVSEMRDCEMLKQRFAGNREAPSGKHHRWDEVFIRVAPCQVLGPGASIIFHCNSKISDQRVQVFRLQINWRHAALAVRKLGSVI